MYLVGIVTAIVAVIVMRHTTMRGEVPPFIMELPTYHLPQLKSLLFHLWDKLKHYVKKAFTIILASTIVIWFLQSFTWNWEYIEQADVTEITNQTFAQMMEDETFKNEVLALNSTYDASEITFDVLLEDTTEENQAAYEAVTDRVFNQALLDFETIKNDSAYHDTSDSILAGLGQLIQPLFTPLGFGSNLDRQNGWVFGVSAVTGLIAKEMSFRRLRF